jgi:hypothetical protein
MARLVGGKEEVRRYDIVDLASRPLGIAALIASIISSLMPCVAALICPQTPPYCAFLFLYATENRRVKAIPKAAAAQRRDSLYSNRKVCEDSVDG